LSINDDRLYPLALLAGRPRVEPADAERREAAVELPVEGVSLRELAAVKRIVVFLPDDPLWMLTTLRQAARLLDEALPPLPMLILSRSPAIWLWQTLLYQVSHPDRLRNVHTAPADLSCAELAHRLENAPRLERLASEAALIHGKRAAGLSHAELKVILALLQGQTIGEQAQRLGLSQKTLYTQRLAGVKKLVEYHPHLAPAFRARCCRAHPPAHCRRLNRNGYKRSTIARSSRFFNLSSIVAHSYRGGDPDPLAPPRPGSPPDLSAAVPRRLHLAAAHGLCSAGGRAEY
jgi:DNA-binding CsgD family transcriptional regulator